MSLADDLHKLQLAHDELFDLAQKYKTALETKMTKNEFITKRTEIISDMLDNPGDGGIYQTTKAFARLDDLFDEMTGKSECPSWAQIERDKTNY
jgi:microcystin degradation protein MlrC